MWTSYFYTIVFSIEDIVALKLSNLYTRIIVLKDGEVVNFISQSDRLNGSDLRSVQIDALYCTALQQLSIGE